MRTKALLPALYTLIIVTCHYKGYGQFHKPVADALPVFKKISHPFMPTITSEFFYFSNDGLMWFSTARGLTSFDGSEVVYYSDNEQAYKMGLNKITAMLDDDNGNLYIGTTNGAIVFNRALQQFVSLQYTFADKQELANLTVNRFYKHNANSIYIGVNNMGMLVYNTSTRFFEHVDFSSFINPDCNCKNKGIINSILSFTANRTDSNAIWVGSYNGIFNYNTVTKKLNRQFNVLNPAINKYYKYRALYDVRHMEATDDTTIWFSTNFYGMGRYNTTNGNVQLFLHNARLKTPGLWKAYTLNSFARWKNEHFVLGITAPHPGVFNTRSGTAQLFSVTGNPEKLDDIQFVANDRKGNVWLLNNGGLFASVPEQYVLQKTSIEQQSTKNYLPNQLGDLYYDDKKALYYAAVTFSSGVHVLDTNFYTQKIIPVPLYTNSYTYRETSNEYITMDGSGRLWTTGLETYILEPGGKQFKHAEKISPQLKWMNSNNEESYDIATTAKGDILLKTIPGHVYHINHQTFKTDTLFAQKNRQPVNHFISSKAVVYDSSRNRVYVNNEATVLIYDLNNNSSRVLPVAQILSSSAHLAQKIEFSLDHEHRIWIWAPRFGIYIVNPDSFVCEDSIANGERGFISGNYDYLRYGGDGYMFLMGQKGTLVYNYKKQRSLLFEHVNLWSGVLPYFFGYSNNHLVMNERNGIRYYNLNNFNKFDFTVKPVINTITSDTTVIYIRDSKKSELSLPYHHNNLSFLFSAQEFFLPESIQYAYQLVGIDEGWQYTNALNRKINYTNLPPGKYSFKLKAQIEGGNWSGEELIGSIEIVPAFWQRPSFRLAIALLAIGIAITLVHLRITSIRNKEEQKTRFEKELLELEAKALRMQMNPHFIFNSLNSIKSIIDKNENEKAAMYLTTFSKLIRILFQNSDKREVSLYEELETCRLYTTLEKMRFGDKVNFIFDVDETLDLKDIKVPALILQPFIENAIWHGLVPTEDGGRIVVSVQQKGTAVECIIDDNGIGRALSGKFKAAYQTDHQSKGITLTQKRLELDKILNNREDDIKITDKIKEADGCRGTTVTLTFKETIV